MLHVLSLWVLIAGFWGAGLFNAIGTPATRGDFVRWGYPPWWCRLTGGVEIMCGGLIALPVSRKTGLMLGVVIIAAAISTVLRHREFSHLVPLGIFVALLAVTEFSA